MIYANSGLFCIEQEMEDFASKYSAYNKCQMVYMFLNEVIYKTNDAIREKTEFLTRTMLHYIATGMRLLLMVMS